MLFWAWWQRQPGEPSASLLVEHWAKQTFAKLDLSVIFGISLTHYPIIAPLRGSHGLSARRAWRTLSSRPKALHVYFISLNWKVTVQYHSFKNKAKKTICWTLLSLFTRSSKNWNEESNWHRNIYNSKESSLIASVSEHGFEKWSRTRSNKLWCGKWKTSHCSQVKPS